jgi:hypothetical protein
MHCVKMLGERLTARDFDPQVAEFQVRVAVLNGFTALGIPDTEAVGQVCPGKGKPGPSNHSCNRAVQWDCQVDGGTLARMLNLDDLSCRKAIGIHAPSLATRF